MTEQKDIVQAFVKLGSFIAEFVEKQDDSLPEGFIAFSEIVRKAQQQNGWFTHENILFALKNWGNLLTETNLEEWLKKYPLENAKTPKTVGVVMAGNIPLVGFHDFLCVLLSGNRVMAKLSSNDTVLLPFLTEYLIEQQPPLADRVRFTEEKFENFDAVIATGSNNTSRYFEYYFGKYPSIIRKNRNSVAILTGQETEEELHALGEDIFRYYGLGCRNVSKIYVPENYDFDPLFKAVYGYKDIIHQHKYANNYDYNKAVYLMSNMNILDNGFLILKEDEGFSSPISTLFYEHYKDAPSLAEKLQMHSEDIQCVVSKDFMEKEVAFGQTQNPSLSDYADGIDTMEFLLLLK